MDKKILGELNRENAEVICSKINLDAEEEVRGILENSRKESEKIISQARLAAEDKKQAILKDLELELRQSREKMVSSLNLEKKRLVLAEKDKFVQSVLAEVVKRAQAFRKDSNYPEFLEKAVLEGVKVIAQDNIEIYYSSLDDHLFNDGFTKKIKSACSIAMKKDCSVKVNKADFVDLGVIVNSPGRRIVYDNRFLARLERVKERIYMELLKGSF